MHKQVHSMLITFTLCVKVLLSDQQTHLKDAKHFLKRMLSENTRTYKPMILIVFSFDE